MNQPWVYMCPPSWTPLPPPSPSHPSGSSQCTSPECPVPCIEPGLVICFTYDNIHVSMLFSQIIPPSPSPTESKSLFFTSVPLLLWFFLYFLFQSKMSRGYIVLRENHRLWPEAQPAWFHILAQSDSLVRQLEASDLNSLNNLVLYLKSVCPCAQLLRCV